jgi:Protein of unknown function (DUF2817)
VSALSAYSPDYATARRRFRELATRLGWEQEAHPIEIPSSDGQQLTIDVATSPGRDSGKAVVISSGLHGVEGFFGSAVQIGVLGQWAQRNGPPPGIRYLFLHALNPYGFDRVRRWNEDNVDPNRNFLTEGQAYTGSPPGYAALNRLLNPERPPSALEPFRLKALLAIAWLGLPALKQAVAGGQFDYPRGLFYGGTRPTRTNEILAENLGGWVHGCDEVIHLDFHTGLGGSATYKLLIDFPLTDRQKARLVEWFGPDSFEICDPSLISYHVSGGFDRWCVAQIPGCDYLHLCAEFGTYSPIQVVGALRAENQAHHWGKPSDRATVRAKDRLKEVFCPAKPDWRTRCYEAGAGLVDKAVACLTAKATIAAR